jgi:hypothetical protein
MRTYVHMNFHLNFLNISKCINDVFQNKEEIYTQEAKHHLLLVLNTRSLLFGHYKEKS